MGMDEGAEPGAAGDDQPGIEQDRHADQQRHIGAQQSLTEQ